MPRAIHKKKSRQVKASSNPLLDSVRRKVFSFLGIGETKRIAIVSDNDQDGITSSVQLKKFFKSKKIEFEVFFYDHYSKKLARSAEHFADFSPEKTVFLDLSDGLVSDVLLQVGKYTGPFLVLDHHQSESIKNTIFMHLVVKPWSFSEVEPSKYPVSRMVFDIFGGIDWVCAIGVIGDFAFEQWRAFLDKVKKKHNLSEKQLFDLDEIVVCVSSQYPEKINSLFGFLCSAKNPHDLLKSEFVAFKKLFDQKLEAMAVEFEKEAERFPEGVCFFHTEERFSSKLSNVISSKYKDKVIIILEQPGELLKCSIRRQDFKVNCGNLAKFCTSSIPNAKGGGHIPAAGATFPPQYEEEFKTKARMFLLENPN
jgi:single-stranded DNA-specific DHH superfamily exonuclease